MPYRDKEQKRAHDRERLRQRRKARKEADAEYQISHGNLNYDLKPVRDNPFPSYRQWKLANPEGTFQQYLEEKIESAEEMRKDRIAQEQDGWNQDHTRTTQRPMSEEQRRKQALIDYED